MTASLPRKGSPTQKFLLVRHAFLPHVGDEGWPECKQSVRIFARASTLRISEQRFVRLPRSRTRKKLVRAAISRNCLQSTGKLGSLLTTLLPPCSCLIEYSETSIQGTPSGSREVSRK